MCEVLERAVREWVVRECAFAKDHLLRTTLVHGVSVVLRHLQNSSLAKGMNTSRPGEQPGRFLLPCPPTHFDGLVF